MAKIINLEDYNKDRRKIKKDNDILDTIKVKTKQGDTLILKPEEIKSVIMEYIDEQIDLSASSTVLSFKMQLKTKIDFKLDNLEKTFMSHINVKIDEIADKIVSNSIDRVIEEEVKRRVNIKLDKIKKEL